MIIKADWEVRNSQRKYPFDEACSTTGDDGNVLPEAFLVDANIWVPKYLYAPAHPLRFVYLSSAQVSSSLVSLTILGCTDHLGSPEAEFVPLGSISLVKPITAYRNYQIEPLLDGVMGWVAFGHAVLGEESLFFRFSQPNQAMFCPKAVRYYDYLPIDNAGVYQSSTTVTGDVALVVQDPFTAEIKNMRVDGEAFDRPMIVISLKEQPDVLESFAGPCGKRPETGNCNSTPITSISGVQPDCTGNIDITFDPEIIVRKFTNPAYPIPDPEEFRGGICLDSIYSVPQLCNKVQTLPDSNGILPGEYTYERPCDLPVPFTEVFDGVDSFKRVQISAGYAYVDGSECYLTAGYLEAAEIGPCLAALPLEFECYTSRAHSIVFGDVPNLAKVGMYAFDTINTRILVEVQLGDESNDGWWAVSRFNKALNEYESVLASGVWPMATTVAGITVTLDSDRNVTVDISGTVVTQQLDSDDVYYAPTGKCGAFVGGSYGGYDFTPRPAVNVMSYSVQDL